MPDPYSDIPGFIPSGNITDTSGIPGFIPASQPSMWDSTVTWPNFVRMAGSTASDYLGAAAAPFTGGLGYPAISFAGGAASEGIARAMEGQSFNPYIMATEGAFNLMPGPNIPGARAGLGELAQYGAKSVGYGAAQGLAGAYPRYVAETGDWGGPSLGEYGAQTAMGGAVGGAVGMGLAGAHRGLESIGHTASAPPPIQPTGDMGQGDLLAGVPPGPPPVGPSNQMPLFPQEQRPMNLQRGSPFEPYGDFSQPTQQQFPGMEMQGDMFGGQQNEYPLPFNQPNQQPSPPPPAAPPTAPTPSPFGEGTAPTPTSTTPIEGVLPMTVSLRQASSSDVALWKTQGYVYVPGLKGSDGFDMMVRGDVAPVYVRLRGLQQPVETPAPEPAPVARPEMASAMGANETAANNTVVIPTAKASNPSFLANMDAGGYKLIENRPDGMSIFQKFMSDESGTFDPQQMWENLKRLFGRDPTPEEVQRGMDRQVREGETTGRVAPMPPPEILAMRQDDLLNTPRPTGEPILRPGEGERAQPLSPEEEAWLIENGHLTPDSTIPNDRSSIGEAIPGIDKPRPQPNQGELPFGPFGGTSMRGLPDDVDFLMRQMAPRTPQAEGPLPTQPDLPDTVSRTGIGEKPETIVTPEIKGGSDDIDDDFGIYGDTPREQANGARFEAENALEEAKQLLRDGKAEEAHRLMYDQVTRLSRKYKNLANKLDRDWMNFTNPPPAEPPRDRASAMDEMRARLERDMNNPPPARPRNLEDMAEELSEALDSKGAVPSPSLVLEILRHVNGAKNTDEALRNLSDIRAHVDSATTPIQKSIFEDLYQRAFAKYHETLPKSTADTTAPKSEKKITVRQMTDYGSKQWGIYVDGQLIEGGFFKRKNAEKTAVREYGPIDTSDPHTEFPEGFEDEFNESFQGFDRSQQRAYAKGQLDLPLRGQEVGKFDVTNKDGKIIRTFDSRATAEDFITHHPEGRQLDYGPHDPSWGNADEVIPEFKAPTEKQLPLKLRSEAYWKKRSLGINQADVDDLVSGIEQNRLLSHLSWNWAKSDLRDLSQTGRPGLSVDGDDIIYRGPDGAPVAHIQLIHSNFGAPEVASFAADRTKGLLYGRATFAVAKKAFEMNAFKMGSYSKHTKNFIDGLRRFLDDDKGTVDFSAFGPAWDRIKMAAVRLRKNVSENLRVGEVWDQVKKFAADETGAIPAKDATPGAMFGRAKEMVGDVKKNMGWGQGINTKKNEFNFIREALALPSAATTTGDFSPPGRQGLSLINTKEFWKAGAAMFKGFTPAGFKQIDEQLRSKPIFQDKIDMETGKVIPSFGKQIGMKLFSTASDAPIGKRAEATASRWLETGAFLGGEKIPFTRTKNPETGQMEGGVTNPLAAIWKHTIGYPIRATNRSFITFLNHLNANRTEFLLNKARDMSIQAFDTGSARPGFLKQNYTKAEALDLNPYNNIVRAKEIADFVNTATGHGPLKTHILPFKQAEVSLEGAAGILNMAMFSPGLFASRIRMLNPSTYIMATPFVRKQYMKAALSTAGAWFAFTEMIKQAGGDEVQVNNNLNDLEGMTSADFGKVRIGNTRMDAGGGFLQFLVQYARMYKGGYTSSANQQFHPFGEGYQAQTQLSNAQRFMSNKLNPVAKFAYDLANQSQNVPFHVYDRTAQLFVPLVVQDIIELSKEDPSLLPWMAPIALGMGTQTYSKGESVGKLIAPEDDWLAGGGGIEDLGLNQEYR